MDRDSDTALITGRSWRAASKSYLSEFRSVWMLLYPIIISSLAGYCLNLFDYRWIRDLSAADLALLALVNGSVVTFMFLLSKSFEESFVSIYAKATKEEHGELLLQAILFALGAGSSISIILLLAREPLVGFLSGGILSNGKATFFYALIIATFPMTLVNTALSAALRVYRDSKTPARISIGCGLLNNVLDPLLIFGVLGSAPQWQIFGLAGASWATRSIYLILSLYALRARLKREQVRLPRMRISLPTQRRFLRLFVPSASLETLSFFANVVVYAALSVYGVHALGGYGVGFELLTIGFVLIKGLSIVFMIRIGQRLRQRADLSVAANSMLILGVLFVGTISVGFFSLRGIALNFLVSNQAVAATARELLNYAPVFIASYLMSTLVTGCCQLIERPTIAMCLGLFFGWFVNLGSVYAVVRAQVPLESVFVTLAVVSATRMVIYFAIFRWLIRRLTAINRLDMQRAESVPA